MLIWPDIRDPKFVYMLQEDPKFVSERNLTQLVLPVCTTYLLNQEYVKHSQLVEQAIGLLGAICRTLPWNLYEMYIRYYTGLFTKVGPLHYYLNDSLAEIQRVMEC